jgi:hypothetical protein
MQARINALRLKYAGSPADELILDKCQMEIDDFARNSSYYGYMFLVMAV